MNAQRNLFSVFYKCVHKMHLSSSSWRIEHTHDSILSPNLHLPLPFTTSTVLASLQDCHFQICVFVCECVCQWTSQMGNSALCLSWQNRRVLSQVLSPTTMTEQNPIVYSNRLLSENWDIPHGLVSLLFDSYQLFYYNYFNLTTHSINIPSDKHIK